MLYLLCYTVSRPSEQSDSGRKHLTQYRQAMPFGNRILFSIVTI